MDEALQHPLRVGRSAEHLRDVGEDLLRELGELHLGDVLEGGDGVDRPSVGPFDVAGADLQPPLLAVKRVNEADDPAAQPAVEVPWEAVAGDQRVILVVDVELRPVDLGLE